MRKIVNGVECAAVDADLLRTYMHKDGVTDMPTLCALCPANVLADTPQNQCRGCEPEIVWVPTLRAVEIVMEAS